MLPTPFKRIKKFFKWTGIGILTILALMWLLPLLFPGFVSTKVKSWVNQSIESKLDFNKARLSFFTHFPSLTLDLHEVILLGSKPFATDTLLAANELAFGVNLWSLFSKEIKIDEIYLNKGKIQVLVDEAGHANYNIYKSKPNSSVETKTDSSSAALRLNRIQIEDCQLAYLDKSLPFELKAAKLNYLGKGDFSEAIFGLDSKINTEGLYLTYGNEPYLRDKKLSAKIRTQINTQSLSISFQRNNLQINQLPFRFVGKMDFLKDGYHLDIQLQTKPTGFADFVSAMPPAATNWLDKKTVKGQISLNFSLVGDYIAANNQAPDLAMNMGLSDGEVAEKLSNDLIENIQIAFNLKLPNLDLERLAIDIDTLHAKRAADEIALSIHTKGYAVPHLKGIVHAKADLEKWTKVLGLTEGIDLKGLLNLQAKFKGIYHPPTGKFPVSNMDLKLNNGWLKTSNYPNPITNLQVDAAVENKTGMFNDLKLVVKPIALQFENQPFTLSANLAQLNSLEYQVKSKGVLNLGKLYRLFAVEGYDLDGKIETDFELQGTEADAIAGRLDKLNNKGSLTLYQIGFSAKEFPKPFLLKTGAFHFNQDKLLADEMNLNYGETEAHVNGSFSNIIAYLLNNNANLHGNLNLVTPHVLIDEWMAAPSVVDSKTGTASSKTEPTGVVLLPTNLDLNVKANIAKISFQGMALNNFETNASVSNGKLTISNADFNFVDAPMHMKLGYEPNNGKTANFNYAIKADSFDIKKAYAQVQLLRELAPAAEKAEGMVSLDYSLDGLLDQKMYPVFSSLKGAGVLTLKKVKVFGLKMFSAISEKTNTDKIENPDLSNVQIKSSIANNILTIERVKLKVKGFRPRFEGQIGLDGRLNLNARLGLPPFGILGIPLSITGTQDKPVVKLRRSKESDNLNEIDADEEDKKEAAEAEAKAAELKKQEEIKKQQN